MKINCTVLPVFFILIFFQKTLSQSKSALKENPDVLWVSESTFNIEFDRTICDYESDYKYFSFSDFSAVPGKSNFRTLIDFLFDAVMNGEITPFAVNLNEPDFLTALSHSSIVDYITRRDSVLVENPSTYDMETKVVETKLQKNDFVALKIYQEWYYNEASNKLIIKIPAVGLCNLIYSETGEIRGYKTMCYIKLDEPVSEKNKTLLNDSSVVWSDRINFIALADSISDFKVDSLQREEEQLKMMFNKKLPRYLYDAAYNGKLAAYSDSEMKNKLTVDQVKKSGNTKKTLMVQNYETMEMEEKTVFYELDKSSLTNIKPTVQWSFNKKDFKLEAKLKSAVVLSSYFSDSGDKRYKELFRVKFDN